MTTALFIAALTSVLDALRSLIKAKINGVIPSIKPILNKSKATDFRLSADIENQALNAAGEI
jgi:predicted nucleic acid-binding protein